ncbi:MAG: DUF7594 domain-containing protein, partial [Acidimicrobiia bacterium]
MSDSETPAREKQPRDQKQTTIIILAVVVTILVGLIIGFIASGGLSGDPVASPTTVGPVATTPPSGSTPATTLPPTTVVPGQLSIPATEDTYVNSGQPEEINGLEDVMEIENDAPEVKSGLVRFEVAGIPEGETIDSVTLRLFVVADTEDVIALHTVGGDWNQAETTGATAPPVGDPVGSIPPGTPEGSVVEVDMTSLVTGPGQYDLYLVSPGDDSAEFATIESGTNPPLLIVDYGDGAAAAGGVTELAGEPFVLAGAGDIANCGVDGDATTAQLLDLVVSEHDEAIVFTTGDNAYSDGSSEDFAECYAPTWGRHLERTRPAPGNHEYETADAAGYFGYFGEAAGSPGEGYYAYEAGDWQVIALNSNCDEVGGCEAGSPQERWLRQELQGSDARCTLAYWHHPLFSSGDHGGWADVRPLFQALYDDGAELVLNGHDHNFERFALQDPTGTHDPV